MMKCLLLAFTIAVLLCGSSANAQMMQAIVNSKAVSAGATWTVVASAKCGFTGLSTGCTTSAINTTTSNLIVLSYGFQAIATGLSVSDSPGNTYTSAISNTGSPPDTASNMDYKISPTTSASHTFTFNATAAFGWLTVLAVKDNSGIPSTTGTPTQACASATTTVSPGSLTPATNHSLVVSNVVYNDTTGGSGTLSVGSGLTIDQSLLQVASNHYAGAQAYLDQSPTAAINPTWTATQTGTSMCALLAAWAP